MYDEAAHHLRAFLEALGLRPEDDPELERTPQRFAELMRDMTAGLTEAPPVLSTFDVEEAGMPAGVRAPVLLIDLPFHSMCVHHLVPFFGGIDVAYVPERKMVGFGSIGRVIEHFARRPQVQERLVEQIAGFLDEALAPRGVLVRLRSRQMCMELRGTKKRGNLVSIAARGELATGAVRQEILEQFNSTPTPR